MNGALARYRRAPRPVRIGAIVVAILVLVPLLLAAAPWQLLKGPIAARLSAKAGAPVTIGAATRESAFSFHPTLVLSDVRVGRSALGGASDLGAVRRLSLRFAAWPLLVGRLRLEAVVADGLTAHLVRDAAGRWNVGDGRKRAPGARPSSGSGLEMLTVRDGRLIVEDAKRHMTLDAHVAADAGGVRLDGGGTHRGTPLRLTLAGAPVLADAPWDFRVSLASPLLRFDGTARTAHPLSLDRMTATILAYATDARYLDDVIEAGLPGTQPITLRAQVRHEKPDWHVTGIDARLGRSPFTGKLDVLKRDGRTILDGDLRFAALDFDDLSSNEGKRQAAVRRAAIGPRVIPDTQIHFEKLARTDGVLRLDIRRLLSNGPSYFQSARTTMTMDHRKLTLAPLTVGLTHGTLAGRVAVDHREGQPKLSLDLALVNGRLEDLTGSTVVAAPLRGAIHLAGTGRTIRAALGASAGRIGLAGTGGSMARKLAVIASGDVLKSIGQAVGGDDAARTPLRCFVARFTASSGRIAARDLLLDTEISRADGSGAILLPAETIDLALTGAAKRPGAIQVAAPVRLIGTLSQPQVQVIPQSVRKKGFFAKAGAILKGLSTGGDRPVAHAANCTALSAAALR